MALPARRAYAGAAPACTLSSDISNSATSFSITGTTTNWPTTATGPFYMVIDPGLSTEEKVLVGARTTGSLSSVTRAVDGTTASAHVAGATCYPVFTAVDANEANLLASTMTTKGDLLSTDGSDPKRLAVGTNNYRLVAASGETTGLKWVADSQDTVIDAKGDLLVGTAADTTGRLAVGTNDQYLVAASGETTGLKWATLGGYTSYSPTLGGVTLGNGTKDFAYTQIGKFVHFQGRFTLGTTSDVTGQVTITLPVNTYSTFVISGTALAADYTVSTYDLIPLFINGTDCYLYYANPAATYPNLLGTSGTVPMDWGNQDFFEINLFYRAA